MRFIKNMVILVVAIMLFFVSCNDINSNISETTSAIKSENNMIINKEEISVLDSSTVNSNENVNIGGVVYNTIYTKYSLSGPFTYTDDNSKFSYDMFYALQGLSPDYVENQAELVDGQLMSSEREVEYFAEYFLIPKIIDSGKTTDFEYTVREGGFVEITKCLNNSDYIEIPSSVNGYTVAYIGNEVFKKSTVKGVNLPEGILAIGEQAFYEAQNLETINFPDSLITISSYAFNGCKNLKNVTFCNKLKTIGENSFENCTFLESINIPDSLNKIYFKAFQNCEKLNCSLKFGSDFYEIMSSAFENTAITSVEFSDGLYTTGAGVFSGCSKLKKVVFPSEIGDSENGIGWGSFMGCSSLEEVNIPKNLIGIMSDMFRGCNNLKTIRIPSSVEFISSDVFVDCNSLKDIYFDGADCSIYYNSFLFTRGITVHAPKGGSIERFFKFRPLIKFVPTT